MTKKNNIAKKTALILSAGALMVFTSSKKEAKETIYADQIEALTAETLLDGGHIEADSIRGKMLLLNFWASYDPASRINTYNLLKLGDDFATKEFAGGKGLDIVCISLDVFHSPVAKAIEADGTKNFYHICDFKGVESPLAQSFDVNRPVNLLISSDGRILARDFGSENLTATLQLLEEQDMAN